MVTKEQAAASMRAMGFDAEVVRESYGETVMVYGLTFKMASDILDKLGYHASMGVRPERGKA